MRGFLVTLGILTTLTAVAAFRPAALAGQSAPAKKPWTMSRTPWGDPDLQGKWSYATITPLERPNGQASKEILSGEEVAALNEGAKNDADRRDGGADADLARAYNAYWYDRGKSIGRTSLIIDPPDGRLPALTAEGRRRLALNEEAERTHPYDSWEDRPLQERCIIYHGVPPLPTGYNNTYEIFQTPGSVVILDENIHDVRVIPLDGRPHLPPSIRQWNGDSRGHWEGSTLVVETTNYSPKTTFRFPVAAETLHSVERFTRVGADRIDFRFTITDPTTYVRPWTVSLPLAGLPDYHIFEYACHEGNYSIRNVLSGARAQEASASRAR